MPKYLHETIAAITEHEGVSINQNLLSAIDKAASEDEKKVLGNTHK